MKVLMINSSLVDGGAAKMCQRLMAELKRKSIESVLVVKKNINKKEQVLEIGKKNRWWDLMSRLLGRSDIEMYLSDLLHNFWANDVSGFNNKTLFDSLTYQDSTVVHMHNLHGQYFNLKNLINISLRKKTIWTLHDMWAISGHCAHSFECKKWENGCGDCPHQDVYQSQWWDNSRGMWNYRKWVYQRMNIDVVCPSQWLLDKVKLSNLKQQKLHLIPNGVDENVFLDRNKQLMRKELGLPQDKKIILFLAQGGLENVWKGGEYFKKLKLMCQDKDDYFWVIIGGRVDRQNNDGWEKKYFDDELLVAKFMASADVFLYPSLADNCPLVVLESMSCGTPVVTFDTGGVAELVEHGETGYVAKHKDTIDLYSGLISLLDNVPLLKEMSKKSRLRILKKFTIKDMTNSYIDLYKKC
jgi:glycosyltransferase involved in cell wall biosynthesis